MEMGMGHKTSKYAWSLFPGGLEKAVIQANQGYTEHSFRLSPHLKIKILT